MIDSICPRLIWRDPPPSPRGLSGQGREINCTAPFAWRQGKCPTKVSATWTAQHERYATCEENRQEPEREGGGGREGGIHTMSVDAASQVPSLSPKIFGFFVCVSPAPLLTTSPPLSLIRRTLAGRKKVSRIKAQSRALIC